MLLAVMVTTILMVVGSLGQQNERQRRRFRKNRVEGAEPSKPFVVCYYTNWSIYRKGIAKFSPTNINPYLCTHLVYAFGTFDDEFQVTAFDSYQDLEKGGYASFNALKQYNKQLKTLLAIGGWNEGSSRFSELVAYPELRQNFTTSAIRHLRRYNFDGLDLDWEYPGSREGSAPEDKANYATLVKELRSAFEDEGRKVSKGRLLLTMAVPAGQTYIDKGYDIPSLNKNLDFFNLLTYDYTSTFDPITNHHAALLPKPGHSEYEIDAPLNVDWTVKYYLKNGASATKLVVGIPTYGRSYTLADGLFHTLGSSTAGPGEKGNYTNEKGYLTFYEICEAVSVNAWEVRKPYPKVMGPFAFKDNQWVGYDDEKMVARKADYVRENDLGGIMFWTLDSDDFKGLCNGEEYPLVEAAKRALFAQSENEARSLLSDGKDASVSQQRLQKPTPIESGRRRPQGAGIRQRPTVHPLSTPEPPTTPTSIKGFKCRREGFYPNPDDCHKYYWCLDSGAAGLVAHAYNCPSDLVFSKSLSGCDHPSRTKCKVNPKRGGSAKAPSSNAFPTTTEFDYSIAKDYDQYSYIDDYYYYYDDESTSTALDKPPLESDLNIRNSGNGNQFQSISPVDEKSVLNNARVRQKPQYTKIQRDRVPAKESQVESISPVDDEPPAEANLGGRQRPQYTEIQRDRSKVQTVQEKINEETFIDRTQSRQRPQYVNIERDRPAATDSETTDIFEGITDRSLEYVTINRQRPAKVTELINDEGERTTEQDIKYVTLNRNRPSSPSFEESTTLSSLIQPDLLDDPISPVFEKDIQDIQLSPGSENVIEPKSKFSLQKPRIKVPESFILESRVPASPIEEVESTVPVQEAPIRVPESFFRFREIIEEPSEQEKPHDTNIIGTDRVSDAKDIKKPEQVNITLDVEVKEAEKSDSVPVIPPDEPAIRRPTSKRTRPDTNIQSRRRLTHRQRLGTQRRKENAETKADTKPTLQKRPSLRRRPSLRDRQNVEDPAPETVRPANEEKEVKRPSPLFKTTDRRRTRLRTGRPGLVITPVVPEEEIERTTKAETPSPDFQEDTQEPTHPMKESVSQFFDSIIDQSQQDIIETPAKAEKQRIGEQAVEDGSELRSPHIFDFVLQNERDPKEEIPLTTTERPRTRRIISTRAPTAATLSTTQSTTSTTTTEDSLIESTIVPDQKEALKKSDRSSFQSDSKDQLSFPLFTEKEEARTIDEKKPSAFTLAFEELFSTAIKEQSEKTPLDELQEEDSPIDTERSTTTTPPSTTTPPPSSTTTPSPATRTTTKPITSTEPAPSTTTTTTSPTPKKIIKTLPPSNQTAPPTTTTSLPLKSSERTPRFPGRARSPLQPVPLPQRPLQAISHSKPETPVKPIELPSIQESESRPPLSPHNILLPRLPPVPIVRPRLPSQPITTRPRFPPQPVTRPPPRTTPDTSPPPRSIPPRLSSLPEYEYVYDYYEDTGSLSGTLAELATLNQQKAVLRADGNVQCFDTGYFPHPTSCKKFISCSKTVSGVLRGWIYTCPQELVFDPVGGICNWTEAVDCLSTI